MLKKYLGLAAGLLLLAGCSNNDFIDNGATTPEGQMRTISSINATMDNADTRVQLKNGNQLIWNEDDVINVFSDEGSYHNYTLTSGAGTTSATFAGDEITGNQFYALFCNTIFNLDRENDEVSMYWDSDAIFGKDGEEANRYIPLFAKSANANMQFKHLSGLLHFQITGKGKLAYASLYGNNGEEFYDEYTLKYTSDDIALKPYEYATSRDHIGSRPINDIVLSDKYITHIYFMLPVGMTFEKGFKLVIGYVDGDDVEKEVTKEYNKSFTVMRGEVSTFPAVSSTGGSEEPEYGWETNFFDLSGKDVDVSYYFSYDKTQIFWSLIFKTEDNADPIYLDFWMDYKGGNPELSWLSGIVFDKRLPEFADFRFHDFKTGSVYMLNLAESLTISENTDGTWSLRLKNVTLENNDDHTLLYNINLKFDGYFNFIPLPTWNFSGAAWMSGAYTSATMEVEDNTVKYQIRFLDFPWGDGTPPATFQEVMIKFGFVFEGDTPSFPTHATIDDFYLDIFSQGYDWTGVYVKVDDDAVVTIYQNEDGAYEITIKGVKMYPVDEGWETNMAADPIISDFSFVGELEFEPGAIGGI